MKKLILASSVLALLLVIFGGLVWWKGRSPRPHGMPGQGMRLFQVEENAVESWHLRWEDQDFGAERRQGTWHLTGPSLREEMDDDSALAEVKNFLSAEGVEVVGHAPVDAARFGLASPRGIYAFTERVGSELRRHVLLEGAPCPTPPGHWIQVQGDDRIYYAEPWVILALRKNPRALRPRRVLPLEADAVLRVGFSNFALLRKGMAYQIEDRPIALNLSACDQIMQKIAWLSSEWTLEAGDAEIPSASARPAVCLAVRGRLASGVVTDFALNFYEGSSGVAWYVRRQGDGPWMRVDPALARDLPKTADDLTRAPAR